MASQQPDADHITGYHHPIVYPPYPIASPVLRTIDDYEEVPVPTDDTPSYYALRSATVHDPGHLAERRDQLPESDEPTVAMVPDASVAAFVLLQSVVMTLRQLLPRVFLASANGLVFSSVAMMLLPMLLRFMV
jgi:hypothetical protein